ncbi:hypothetical protein F5Y14DRAFT_415682 [Nemania sp. NC0429]|nr:hypothetical protein F5Y14DRAFT_415682 [Nemania sp. NC0429]
MSPIPDDEPHYSGASPLDGGSNPASLGGDSSKFSPSGLEIGLIVGVVSLAVISLVWLFFWRSRRNRTAKQIRTCPATTTRGQDEELADASGLRIPTPTYKDDRASSADNDKASSIEQPPRYHRHPMANESQWPHSHHANHIEQRHLPTHI